MERLTKWNGKKWILPQGRTSDGQSYWRIIAETLAAYEDSGLTPEELKEFAVANRAFKEYFFKSICLGNASVADVLKGE